DLAHIPYHVVFERAHGWLKVKSIHSMARVSFQIHGQHAADIRICLGYCDSLLEPCQRAVAPNRGRLRQIDPRRQDHIYWDAFERKALRHHADDLARPGVERYRLSDHAWVGAKAAFPISVGQNDRLRRAWLIVSVGKPAAYGGLNTQCR